jgi:hypothetical protein
MTDYTALVERLNRRKRISSMGYGENNVLARTWAEAAEAITTLQSQLAEARAEALEEAAKAVDESGGYTAYETAIAIRALKDSQ